MSGDHMQRVIAEAVRKLKAGMDDGPFAPPITLTTEEACALWRVIDIFAPQLTENNRD